MSSRNDRRFYKKRAKKETKKIPAAITALQKEAHEKHGELARQIVAGWSFILSVGQFNEVRRNKPEEFREQIRKMLNMPDLDYLDTCDGKCGETHEHYHFSARVNPHTRSSVLEDWKNLGFATAALGIPEEVVEAVTKQIEDDEWVSRRAIHYPWSVPLN